MSSDTTARRNCECNMGSSSLNTINRLCRFLIPYFFKFMTGNMTGYYITTKNSKSMQYHCQFKLIFTDKQSCKSKTPCNVSPDNRRFEVKCSSIHQNPESIQSQKQGKTFYRVNPEVHG